MAWQEVDVKLKLPYSNKQPTARVRSSVHGGLTLQLNRRLVETCGLTDGQRLTLLVGGGESEGKIALKPKDNGPIAVSVFTAGRNASVMQKARNGSASVRIGHFGRLAPLARRACPVGHEVTKVGLILTLPDGWLVSAT